MKIRRTRCELVTLLFNITFFNQIVISICSDNERGNLMRPKRADLSLTNSISPYTSASTSFSNLSKPFSVKFYFLTSSKVKYQFFQDCCDDTIIIDSLIYPEGYLKAPPVYEEINEAKNSKSSIECLYKFYGRPDERIQLFYEDFDLFYPYNIYKFNKIE